MRRSSAVVALAIIAAGAVSAGERGPSGAPTLRMPFPAGTVVLCQQGTRSPAGLSHSIGNCLHALDFSSCFLEHVQLGLIAEREGRRADAAASFRAALAFPPDATEFADAAKAGLARVEAP